MKLKQYIKGLIIGITGIFILKVFVNNWQSIIQTEIQSSGWIFLSIALLITICAHIWSGFVWVKILGIFKQYLPLLMGLKLYLITNIYKYIPGNVGHFYARITELKKQGGTLSVISISVLLEPLLMAVAALFISLLANSINLIETSNHFILVSLQWIVLIGILLGIHPLFLNKLLSLIQRIKTKDTIENQTLMTEYPLIPLLGEIFFILLRGTGFLFTWMSISSLSIEQIPLLLSTFSFAWLMGLIIPGAPGGTGVFEATAIALLKPQQLSSETILITVALYRIISLLAELISALLSGFRFKIRLS